MNALVEGLLELALAHRDSGRKGKALRAVARAVSLTGLMLPTRSVTKPLRDVVATSHGCSGWGSSRGAASAGSP
mgnify:CR=1 FL=1